MAVVGLRQILEILRGKATSREELRTTCRRLVDVLKNPVSDESFMISVGLCLNALAKRDDVQVGVWNSLAKWTMPLLQQMPARQLALSLNAFSKVQVVHTEWIREAARALETCPKGCLNGQDVALVLNGLSRLSHADEALLLRLVRDDIPPIVGELQAQGLAGVTHALVQLKHVGAADFLDALLERLAFQALRMNNLRPLECAILIDAFTRLDVVRMPQAAGALRFLSKLVEPSLPRLGVREVLMLVNAYARQKGLVRDLGLAEPLKTSVEATLRRLTVSELSMMVHSSAQLGLELDGKVVLGAVSAVESSLQESCGSAHMSLLIHGLSKLHITPSSSLWAMVETSSVQMDLPSKVRIFHAAARVDRRSSVVYNMAERIALGDLDSKGLAAVVYAQLHPFYFDAGRALSLLSFVADHRKVETQSFALQLHAGLINMNLLEDLTRAPVRTLRSLLSLSSITGAWSHSVRDMANWSTMQLHVEREVVALLENGSKSVLAEVSVWPFSIDVAVHASVPPDLFYERLTVSEKTTKCQPAPHDRLTAGSSPFP